MPTSSAFKYGVTRSNSLPKSSKKVSLTAKPPGLADGPMGRLPNQKTQSTPSADDVREKTKELAKPRMDKALAPQASQASQAISLPSLVMPGMSPALKRRQSNSMAMTHPRTSVAVEPQMAGWIEGNSISNAESAIPEGSMERGRKASQSGAYVSKGPGVRRGSKAQSGGDKAGSLSQSNDGRVRIHLPKLTDRSPVSNLPAPNQIQQLAPAIYDDYDNPTPTPPSIGTFQPSGIAERGAVTAFSERENEEEVPRSIAAMNEPTKPYPQDPLPQLQPKQFNSMNEGQNTKSSHSASLRRIGNQDSGDKTPFNLDDKNTVETTQSRPRLPSWNDTKVSESPSDLDSRMNSEKRTGNAFTGSSVNVMIEQMRQTSPGRKDRSPSRYRSQPTLPSALQQSSPGSSPPRLRRMLGHLSHPDFLNFNDLNALADALSLEALNRTQPYVSKIRGSWKTRWEKELRSRGISNKPTPAVADRSRVASARSVRRASASQNSEQKEERIPSSESVGREQQSSGETPMNNGTASEIVLDTVENEATQENPADTPGKAVSDWNSKLQRAVKLRVARSVDASGAGQDIQKAKSDPDTSSIPKETSMEQAGVEVGEETMVSSSPPSEELSEPPGTASTNHSARVRFEFREKGGDEDCDDGSENEEVEVDNEDSDQAEEARERSALHQLHPDAVSRYEDLRNVLKWAPVGSRSRLFVNGVNPKTLFTTPLSKTPAAAAQPSSIAARIFRPNLMRKCDHTHPLHPNHPCPAPASAIDSIHIVPPMPVPVYWSSFLQKRQREKRLPGALLKQRKKEGVMEVLDEEPSSLRSTTKEQARLRLLQDLILVDWIGSSESLRYAAKLVGFEIVQAPFESREVDEQEEKREDALVKPADVSEAIAPLPPVQSDITSPTEDPLLMGPIEDVEALAISISDVLPTGPALSKRSKKAAVSVDLDDMDLNGWAGGDGGRGSVKGIPLE
ncbi:hypothetical protein HDU67_002701 [Dinochytrium kinnereticum]|nr:hypothetical protein HDU67_002701 [Dinochytrium kinnereticum]